MVVSSTFNASDLSPYAEDNFEDLLNLSANPLEEWKFGIEQRTLEDSPNPNEA